VTSGDQNSVWQIFPPSMAIDPVQSVVPVPQSPLDSDRHLEPPGGEIEIRFQDSCHGTVLHELEPSDFPIAAGVHGELHRRADTVEIGFTPHEGASDASVEDDVAPPRGDRPPPPEGVENRGSLEIRGEHAQITRAGR